MERLYQEVGFIAYHFHWSREEILSLPHKERHRWVKEISEINKKINKVSSAATAAPRAPASMAPPGSRVVKGGLDFSNPYPNE